MPEDKKPIPYDQLPSNRKSKAAEPEVEEKNIEKVISGTAVSRKKPLGRKIADTFTGDDAKSVGHYLLFEVMLPAAKNLIFDVITQGSERTLFGDVRGRIRPTQQGAGRRNDYVPYNQAASKPVGPERTMSSRGRATHDFDEIILPDRGEAQAVIDGMFETLQRYQVVTVADLYALVGISGNFTDNKYGWDDLSGASILRIRGGYLLDLPKAELLD